MTAWMNASALGLTAREYKHNHKLEQNPDDGEQGLFISALARQKNMPGMTHCSIRDGIGM